MGSIGAGLLPLLGERGGTERALDEREMHATHTHKHIFLQSEFRQKEFAHLQDKQIRGAPGAARRKSRSVSSTNQTLFILRLIEYSVLFSLASLAVRS